LSESDLDRFGLRVFLANHGHSQDFLVRAQRIKSYGILVPGMEKKRTRTIQKDWWRHIFSTILSSRHMISHTNNHPFEHSLHLTVVSPIFPDILLHCQHFGRQTAHSTADRGTFSSICRKGSKIFNIWPEILGFVKLLFGISFGGMKWIGWVDT